MSPTSASVQDTLLQLNSEPLTSETLPHVHIVDCSFCGSLTTSLSAREFRRLTDDHDFESAWTCSRFCRDEFVEGNEGWTEIAL